MPLKCFIIACEPSGDTHGAHLIQELKLRQPDLLCQGLGGPKMEAAGVRLLHDMTRLSALGLGDVIRRYFTYRKIFHEALREVARFQPDVLILIDSPAFNLRFAKKIKKRFPVLYYIAPQIWAWGRRRIRTIKRTVHKMLVILPFEVDIYEKAGIPCAFVGHPLLDHVIPSASREALRKHFGIKKDQKAIGLLPGSRESEVRRILPPMLQSAFLMKGKIQKSVFFVTQAPNVDPKVYQTFLDQYPAIRWRTVSSRLYDLICALDFALIASGTTTLEAALLETPFFLLYKAGWSTYLLGRQLIRVPYLGLVNLLAGKKVVPEFIQRDIRPKTIAHEAQVLIENPDFYEKMRQEFLEVRQTLGDQGATRRAASAVLEFLDNRYPFQKCGVQS